MDNNDALYYIGDQLRDIAISIDKIANSFENDKSEKALLGFMNIVEDFMRQKLGYEKKPIHISDDGKSILED